MLRSTPIIIALCFALGGCASTPSVPTLGEAAMTETPTQRPELAALARQARDAERGFAKALHG